MTITEEESSLLAAAINMEEQFKPLRDTVPEPMKRHEFALAVVLKDPKRAVAALGYQSKTLANAQGDLLYKECQKYLENWLTKK